MRILRHSKDDAVVISAIVGDECEALLAGRLADHVRRQGHAPVWTWLNAVAHGDALDIERLAAADSDDVETSTIAAVARALLADGRPIDALLRDVLVPLELRIAGDVVTPRRLIELVGVAVYLASPSEEAR